MWRTDREPNGERGALRCSASATSTTCTCAADVRSAASAGNLLTIGHAIPASTASRAIPTPDRALSVSIPLAAADSAAGFRLSPATIVALVGLGLAMASVFMPWVTASIPGFDFSASAWKKGMRFRLGDWLSKDNLDAYAVLGVAAIAAVFTLFSAAGGLFAPVARRLAGTASGLLIPIAIMEFQFVLSKDGVDLGYGLYALAAGAALTFIANMLPAR